MSGRFIIKKMWSDNFCERYALVKWIEGKIDIGVYFLTNNNDLSVGDVINGELIIDCTEITVPMHLNENIEMSIDFDSTHDTYVKANVLINSIIDRHTLYGFINSSFSDIKISMIDEIPSGKLLCGDKINVKGLLTLELNE